MAVPSAASGRLAVTRRAGGVAALLRRHWLLAVLLAAGLTLRILAQAAYRPALLFSDSIRYLYLSGGNDPVGYRVLLKPVLLVGNLDMVAAVQHLLGLAMAVALYILLLRRGVPRALAALATAPVLLDAYQIQMEQSIMSDVLFEALIVAGLVVLLWERAPRLWMVAAGGFALGSCATVREVGQILILPAALYLLVAVRGWRLRLRQAAVLCAAFLLPILAYCTTSYLVTGHFRLANQGTNELYGRVVLAADCHAVQLPADERPLCPTRQYALKLGIDNLVHSPKSPLRDFRPPGPGTSAIAADFTKRVFWQDPAGVIAAIGRDALRLFALTRVTSPGDTPITRWQFQPAYPTYQHVSLQTVRAAGQRFGGGGPTVSRPLAAFLRAYQLHGGYTPGPLLALAALAGLAGSTGVLRRRRIRGPDPGDGFGPDPGDHAPDPGDHAPDPGDHAPDRRDLGPDPADDRGHDRGDPAAAARRDAQRDLSAACLLCFAVAVTLLLASDAFEFSWRYQLPALITLPAAGVLGILAIIGTRAGRPRCRTGHEITAVPTRSALPGSSPVS
jgi:hypothetical protein